MADIKSAPPAAARTATTETPQTNQLSRTPQPSSNARFDQPGSIDGLTAVWFNIIETPIA